MYLGIFLFTTDIILFNISKFNFYQHRYHNMIIKNFILDPECGDDTTIRI